MEVITADVGVHVARSFEKYGGKEQSSNRRGFEGSFVSGWGHLFAFFRNSRRVVAGCESVDSAPATERRALRTFNDRASVSSALLAAWRRLFLGL